MFSSQQSGPPPPYGGYNSQQPPPGPQGFSNGGYGPQPGANQYGQQFYPQSHHQQPQSQSQWSQPPPPGSDPTLPQGWVKQWNEEHRAWFYVNTYAQPPISQWTHPGQPTNNNGNPQAPGPYNNAPPSGGYQPQFPGSNGAVPQQPPQVPGGTRGSAPTSGLMGAGVGALGGLAMGALLNHEVHKFKEHEGRLEHNAYEAGIEQGRHQNQHNYGSSGGYGENSGNSYGYYGGEEECTTTTVHREVHNADGSWYEEDETTTVDDDDW